MRNKTEAFSLVKMYISPTGMKRILTLSITVLLVFTLGHLASSHFTTKAEKALIFGTSVLAVVCVFYFEKRIFGKNKTGETLPDNWQAFISEKNCYYRNLNQDDKETFKDKMSGFLNTTKITGIDTIVHPEDRLLIASFAVIPILKVDWNYQNLHEILLYPNSFDSDFNTSHFAGDSPEILGMVGEGSLENTMIISKPDLWRFSWDGASPHNVVIHECAHLIDKFDGQTDGDPILLFDAKTKKGWDLQVSKISEEMRRKETIIDPYALENNAEFFAVISEHFFMAPNSLAQHYPELYKLLKLMYGQDPKAILSSERH
ncbi:hypothetical protein FUAX_21620 [Fulvitalea axinellae]|uniref:Zinc-dependent peptidase n=1 Tax=Fulvitalea axinellae TaxID=1182444 RepID=A0AAU9DFH9_9BACT|nr:hypothetical protein FUAX_21620 [Fulvitalea axinellae]